MYLNMNYENIELGKSKYMLGYHWYFKLIFRLNNTNEDTEFNQN